MWCSAIKDSQVLQFPDEIYDNQRTVGVSANTGEGMSQFFQAVEEEAEDYMKEFR